MAKKTVRSPLKTKQPEAGTAASFRGGKPSALIDTRVIYCGEGLTAPFSRPLTEIDHFFRKTGKVIVPLTVKEILEEQIARKLA